MNEQKRKFHLPAWAVILDVFGTLFLALGIIAQVGGDALLLPGFPDIRPYAIVLIFAGVLLMLPLVMIIIGQARSPQ